VLGDDNPMQTGSSLPAERQVLSAQLGFDVAALRRLDETSINAMFTSDAVRSALRSRWGAV
jgi:adenosine deaminase